MQKSYSFDREPRKRPTTADALKMIFEFLAEAAERPYVPEEPIRKLCEESPPLVGYPAEPRKLPWLAIVQEFQLLVAIFLVTNGAGVAVILWSSLGRENINWVFVAIGAAICAYSTYRSLRAGWLKLRKVRTARSGFHTWAVVWNIDERVKTTYDKRGREQTSTSYHAQFVYLTEDDTAAIAETETSGDHPYIVDEEFETVLLYPGKGRYPFLADDMFPGTRWYGDHFEARIDRLRQIVFGIIVAIAAALLAIVYFRVLS